MGNDASKKVQVLQGGSRSLSGVSTFSRHDSEDLDPQEFANLLEFYDTSFRNIAEGEVVKGTVVKVTPTEVIVDVGFKSEGIIPIEEFIDETGQVTAQPGDTEESLAHRMTGVDRPTERFRILNGLDQHAQVKPRDRVKIVVD